MQRNEVSITVSFEENPPILVGTNGDDRESFFSILTTTKLLKATTLEIDCNSMELMHEFLVLPFGSLEHGIVGVTVKTWRVLVAIVDATSGAMFGVSIVTNVTNNFRDDLIGIRSYFPYYL
uniref:Uncharacterized protein n=1 Tax=Glossina austeni TaxID=7395 RepID=A0A1A9V0L5_GLOAU